MTTRKSALVLGIIAVALILSVLAFTAQRAGGARADYLPRLYPTPPFELTDSHGESFGLDRLAGKVWVADLIFTRCSGPCPMMSRHMADLHEAFQNETDVHFVSISVDPEHDTPEVLETYAARFSAADSDRWHFLTGPIDAVTTLSVDGFKLGYDGEPIFHSTRFVLVDRQGYIRGYFDGTESNDLVRLSKAISDLIDER